MRTQQILKTARMLRGLSQKELAEKISTSQATYSRMELGQRPIRENESRALARVLGPTLSRLLAVTMDDPQ
jgi:transcriptional regulator with XRE-family HTH domain